MSTPNDWIDDIVQSTGQPSEVGGQSIEGEPDWIDQTIQATQTGGMLRDSRSTAPQPGFGTQFLKGTAEGITSPFTVFGADPELGDDPERTRDMFARGAGTFAGAVLGYLPISKGAGMVLKGAGLIKSAKLFQTGWGGVAKETLAGGLFDAGMSEDVSEVPGRFVRGALIGGGAEIGIMGAVSAFRVGVPKTKIDAHLGKEEVLTIQPGDEIEKILQTRTMMDMGEGDIDVVVATLNGAGPLDAAILGKVADPELVERVVQDTWGDAVSVITREGDEGAEVLLWNNEMQRFRNVDGSAMGIKEVVEPPKTYAEAEKIINDGMLEPLKGVMTLGNELSVHTIESAKAWKQWAGSGSGRYRGLARTRPGFGYEIGVNGIKFDNTPKGQKGKISVLIHEYVHALTGLRNNDSMFEVLQLADDQIAAFKAQGFTDNNLAFYPNLKGAAKEFMDLTLMAGDFHDPGLAKRMKALTGKSTKSDLKYYSYLGQQNELMSRATEALFIDRDAAFKLAPNAAKMVEDVILKQSNKLSRIINPQTARGQMLEQMNKIFNARWIAREGGELEILSAQPTKKITGNQIAQWKRGEKAIQGMRVKTKDGKIYEWQGRGKNGKAKLKDGSTGKILEVAETDVVVPTFGQTIARNGEVKQAILKKFDDGIDSLAFNIPGALGGFQRGFIEGIKKLTKITSIDEYIMANRELFRDANGFLQISELRSKGVAVQRIMDSLGDDAIVIADPDGFVQIKFRNAEVAQNYVRMGDEFSEAFGMAKDRVIRTTDGVPVEISFTAENVMDGILRDAGVPEGALPFYKEQFNHALRDRIVEQLDPENVAVLKKSEAIEVDPEDAMAIVDTENASRSVGLESYETAGGQTVIASSDGVILDIVDDADAAQNFINNYRGPDMNVALDADAPVSTTVMEGPTPFAARPVKPLEQPEFKKGLFDRFSVAIPNLGSMERFMSAAESMGLGPLWSKIYQPTQAAVKKIGYEMQNIAIDRFGGKTYQEMLEQISHKTLQIKPSRRGLPSRYIESVSRTEIESGAGHSRGMNVEELGVASELERLGFKHQGARLLAIDRMVQIYKTNAENFYTQVIPVLQQKGHKLSPAQQEIVEKFADPAVMRALTDPDNPMPESMIDLLRTVGYTDAEIKAVSLVGANKGRGADQFSFALVNRWLDAEFMTGNGRQQFFTKYGMSDLEVSLADDMEAVFYEAAEEAGLDAERYLIGYFPHLKTTGRFGLDAGAHAEYLKGFSDITNEFIEYVRTGELEMYSRDPARVTSKYVRAMKMKTNLQPEIDRIRPMIEQLGRTDERSARIVKEYIAELRHQPTEGFQKLEGMIQQTFDLLGTNVPEDLGKRMVTALTSLSYKAAIPFRLALVIRNWAQTALMTPPRVGGKYYVRGVKAALEDGAYQEALRAGAIDANTLPLAYGDDMLSQTVGQNVFDDVEGLNAFRDKMHSLGIHKAGEKVDQIFRAGFDWYRKPDDVGRAIAYYAQKSRTGDALADFRAGKISYDEMLQQGKVNTFNEPVIEEFAKLVRAKMDNAATDLLGVQLSRETHFRYGHANHPVGWGGVAGRLFGQFGTFPIQYAEYLVQGLRRGSARDRAEFLAMHTAVNSAIVGGGAAVGLNLGNWSTFPAVQYTGGPYADLSLTLVQMMSGSPAEKAMARRNLNMMLPTIENPNSIFVPGSYFVNDIGRAFERDLSMESLGEAAGFRFLTGEEEGDWFTRMFTGG